MSITLNPDHTVSGAGSGVWANVEHESMMITMDDGARYVAHWRFELQGDVQSG
jgi:hypothetical protein